MFRTILDLGDWVGRQPQAPPGPKQSFPQLPGAGATGLRSSVFPQAAVMGKGVLLAAALSRSPERREAHLLSSLCGYSVIVACCGYAEPLDTTLALP